MSQVGYHGLSDELPPLGVDGVDGYDGVDGNEGVDGVLLELPPPGGVEVQVPLQIDHSLLQFLQTQVHIDNILLQFGHF